MLLRTLSETLSWCHTRRNVIHRGLSLHSIAVPAAKYVDSKPQVAYSLAKIHAPERPVRMHMHKAEKAAPSREDPLQDSTLAVFGPSNDPATVSFGNWSRSDCNRFYCQAPEMSRKGAYTTKTDVWALGAVVFEWITAKPWDSSCAAEVEGDTKDALWHFLCKRMLASDPAQRASMEEVMSMVCGLDLSFHFSGLKSILDLGMKYSRKLGSGNYGAVYRLCPMSMKDVETNPECDQASVKRFRDMVAGHPFLSLSNLCCKVVNLQEADAKPRDMKNLGSELKALNELNHANIVGYLLSCRTPNWSNGPIPHLHIIMEYCRGGDLSAHKGKVDGVQAWEWLLQAVSAVRYMHQHNVLHRDIKLANMLLSSDSPPIVKLADLGLSKVWDEQSLDLATIQDLHARTFCGTPLNMAPEVLARSSSTSAYGAAADLWSLGCAFYELVTGHNPWIYPDPPENIDVLRTRVQNDQPPEMVCPVGVALPPFLVQCISRMLEKDPEQRITCDEIMLMDRHQPIRPQSAEALSDVAESHHRLLPGSLKSGPKAAAAPQIKPLVTEPESRAPPAMHLPSTPPAKPLVAPVSVPRTSPPPAQRVAPEARRGSPPPPPSAPRSSPAGVAPLPQYKPRHGNVSPRYDEETYRKEINRHAEEKQQLMYELEKAQAALKKAGLKGAAIAESLPPVQAPGGRRMSGPHDTGGEPRR
eukprot:NODE_143_length_2632_cov_99.329075_g116_i0.p1 GENE.NODE_143_length_2632_cov_99.329075_g116_i0~~NODE_143_length_2632_cov_99.329075_g116_i0.p1  ORF type:complete len:801 (+),score=179.57 NODE_143_length_2632_cov_99.329075_g116_i0:307-2403(+)